MTPEAGQHLAPARDFLDEAAKIAAIHLTKPAARSAYYAAFHAAEALIVDSTGKVAKTHSGVRAEFARLVKERRDIDVGWTAFLARTYNSRR